MNPRSSRATKPHERAKPSPLRSRQREAVTAEILDAAEAVIADKGIAGASIAAIAARAGVAVGTLYNYFPDRDGVVEALFQARRAPPWCQASAPPSTPPRAGSRPGSASSCAACSPSWTPTAATSRSRSRPEQRPLVTGPRRAARPVMIVMLECLTELLRAGVAEGVLADDDLELEARLLAASLKGVLLHQIERGQPFAAQADRVTRLFLDGARQR